MSTELVAFRLGAGIYSKPIEDSCIRFGIDTVLRKSSYIGQIAVESSGFTRTRENLNYSVDGLLRTFGRHRITEEQAMRYGRSKHHAADQEAIANTIYGGEWGADNLGNTEPGDGWRFIGRGLKQLTGRYNYSRCSAGVFGDNTLLHTPELLEQLPWAAISAGWFWVDKGLNAVADTGSVRSVTRAVNGGYNGLSARERWTARAAAEFRKLEDASEQ